jgi:hypothetical protein
VSTKWELLKSVKSEPHDRLACFALADMLEEEGWSELSFCYRWMGWYDRRPGKREGPRLRKRFVWYREGMIPVVPYGEAERYLMLTGARLPALVYQALEPKHSDYQIYMTWEQAVRDLAKALARMRTLLEPPAERKDG